MTTATQPQATNGQSNNTVDNMIQFLDSQVGLLETMVEEKDDLINKLEDQIEDLKESYEKKLTDQRDRYEECIEQLRKKLTDQRDEYEEKLEEAREEQQECISKERYENNQNVAENLLRIAQANPECAAQIEAEVNVLVGSQMTLIFKLQMGYSLTQKEMQMCLKAINSYQFEN